MKTSPLRVFLLALSSAGLPLVKIKCLEAQNPDIHANSAGTHRVLTRYTGITHRAALEETRRSFADSFADVLRGEANRWRNLIATLGKAEKETADLVGMSLLDQPNASGLFRAPEPVAAHARDRALARITTNINLQAQVHASRRISGRR